jgi:tRNA dimethylallyltransferase
MKNQTKQLAIIGATASGKSALAIQVAKELGGIILSIDSLSIYKEIDISSAKPTAEERNGIEHYGIDILKPNEPFDVSLFIRLYGEVRDIAIMENKPLIIVGGTSFYLKMLVDGISPIPNLTDEMKSIIKEKMQNPLSAYEYLYELDSEYMSKIASNDTYRTEKALGIHLGSGVIPSEYFRLNLPIPTIKDNLPIYEIDMDRTIIRNRIKQRTEMMIYNGLIGEVKMLDNKYGRKPNCMKAIGIKETLAYIDGEIDEAKLSELISIHTGQLAKRQTTFNRSQFKDKFMGSSNEIVEQILG